MNRKQYQDGLQRSSESRLPLQMQLGNQAQENYRLTAVSVAPRNPRLDTWNWGAPAARATATQERSGRSTTAQVGTADGAGATPHHHDALFDSEFVQTALPLAHLRRPLSGPHAGHGAGHPSGGGGSHRLWQRRREPRGPHTPPLVQSPRGPRRRAVGAAKRPAGPAANTWAPPTGGEQRGTAAGPPHRRRGVDRRRTTLSRFHALQRARPRHTGARRNCGSGGAVVASRHRPRGAPPRNRLTPPSRPPLLGVPPTPSQQTAEEDANHPPATAVRAVGDAAARPWPSPLAAARRWRVSANASAWQCRRAGGLSAAPPSRSRSSCRGWGCSRSSPPSGSAPCSSPAAATAAASMTAAAAAAAARLGLPMRWRRRALRGRRARRGHRPRTSSSSAPLPWRARSGPSGRPAPPPPKAGAPPTPGAPARFGARCGRPPPPPAAAVAPTRTRAPARRPPSPARGRPWRWSPSAPTSCASCARGRRCGRRRPAVAAGRRRPPGP